MRTRAVVVLTAAVTAAATVPVTAVVHQALAALPSVSVSAPHAQVDARKPAAPTPATAATPTPDTGGASSRPQTAGVVLIETVLPGGEGAGTGMVLTSDGTVLTNYHVVAGSTQIRVGLPGGTRYTATVVGHDRAHDIAVLKLRGAAGLATVTLDTRGVAVGDAVHAVGQGGGQGVLYSVAGKVTGINERITARDASSLTPAETLTGLIRTDAAIVPGYSGGPLFDAQGEVVGIDTAASSRNTTAAPDGAGTDEGYAIPIGQAHSIASGILAGTKTSSNHIGARAALGIQVLPSGTTQHDTGVTVQAVVAGDAAAGAGIERGDVITGIGGSPVANTTDLAAVMDRHYPGQRVAVTWVDPGGATHTATLRLEAGSTN